VIAASGFRACFSFSRAGPGDTPERNHAHCRSVALIAGPFTAFRLGLPCREDHSRHRRRHWDHLYRFLGHVNAIGENSGNLRAPLSRFGNPQSAYIIEEDTCVPGRPHAEFARTASGYVLRPLLFFRALLCILPPTNLLESLASADPSVIKPSVQWSLSTGYACI